MKPESIALYHSTREEDKEKPYSVCTVYRNDREIEVGRFKTEAEARKVYDDYIKPNKEIIR